ncbi:MAG: DUF2723 domain-containing protein [Chloroflexaceae bacterium]|nr:DUF2723 domain-containing protein [Chloroflexaceae bacterium]
MQRRGAQAKRREMSSQCDPTSDTRHPTPDQCVSALYRSALQRWVWDGMIALALTLAFVLLYTLTLFPGIGGGDTAELQRVCATLGVAHSTGYPLYTLTGWLWQQLLPIGLPAWRINLFSAVAAAITLGGMYWLNRMLGHARGIALAASAALGLSLTFWEQATHAEVYALASLLQVALMLALLGWRERQLPFWLIGLVIGLNLAHHRLILLMLPGVVGFVLLTRLPRWRELAVASGALVLPCLLYLSIPWRVPPWEDGWQVLRSYMSSDMVWQWLQPERLWAEMPGRPWELISTLVLPQFLIVGAILALLGTVRLLVSDRALATLVLSSYICFFGFSSAYYVDDIAVFLGGAHVLQAMLIASGATWISQWLPQRMRPLVALGLLALPLALFVINRPVLAQLNTSAHEGYARQLLGYPLPPQSLLYGDGFTIESLRYLQAVEGLRTDIELAWHVHEQRIRDVLAQDRSVYLLHFAPQLPLNQQPEGPFLRVTSEPLHLPANADVRWDDHLQLSGFRLDPGPYRAGAQVPIMLQWQVDAAPAQAYIAFVHIVDSNDQLWAQQDRPPAGVPTNQWQPGQVYHDLYTPQLPADVPPGRYQVLFGWYQYPSLQRLSRLPPQASDTAMLGWIDVVP